VRHERPIHGLLHGIVVVRISEHFATVDDHREPLPDSVPDAEPYAARGVEAHDLDPNPRTVIPEKPLRQAMGAVRVFSDELGSFAPFLFLQHLHAPIRERLGARGSARLQDRREQAEELDARRPGQHERSSTVSR